MKAIKHLLWMLIALSVSISFAACGGDDDNQDLPEMPNQENPEWRKALVGKWMEQNDLDVWGLNLGADGEGYEFEGRYSSMTGEFLLSGTDYISWKVIGKSLKWVYEDGKSESLDIKFLEGNTMRWLWSDPADNGGGTPEPRTFRRVEKFPWE